MGYKLKYDYILWDYNGTILNDIDACISSVNISLAEQKLPLINKQRYYDDFCFPVQNFYKKIGFDFEKTNYEKLAKEFIDNYVIQAAKHASIHKGAKEMMEYFQSLGIKQAILSASEKEILVERIEFYGLKKYFTEIMALDNIYAESKIHLGKEWIKNKDKKRAVLIGDTLHDYEVAQAMGIDCILFSGGHVQKEVLNKLNVTVVDNLEDIKNYIFEDKGKKPTIPKYRNADTSEIQDYDLNQAQNEYGDKFRNNYREFYNDLKNTRKTEDW